MASNFSQTHIFMHSTFFSIPDDRDDIEKMFGEK